MENNGREVSAYSVSDGTLRFIAIAVALLSAESPQTIVFEEIDSGLHPARLGTLVDLIERLTAETGSRVITTTHSPELLSAIDDTTLDRSFVVYRESSKSCSLIRSVGEFPDIEKLRKSQGLARLHSTNWFEHMLYFPGEKSKGGSDS